MALWQLCLALLAALAVLALAAKGLLRWLRQVAAGPPSPKSWVSRARARLFAEYVQDFVRETSTFDGLLAGCLSLDCVEPDGSVRASITPKGPLLSEAGSVHEGALILVLDCVTSFGEAAAGYQGGLSIELGMKLLAPVPVDEQIAVRTKIVKVYEQYRLINLEMELRRGSDQGPLLATAWHMKSMQKTDFRGRLWHGLAARCPPLYRRQMRQWLDWTRVVAQYHRESDAPPAEPSSISSMEALLDMWRHDGAAGEGETIHLAMAPQRLMNVFGTAHGASIAAVFLAALKLHLLEKKGSLAVPAMKSFSFVYKEPVPAGEVMAAVIGQEAQTSLRRRDNDNDGTVHFRGDLYSQDVQRANANFSLLLPADENEEDDDEEESSGEESGEEEREAARGWQQVEEERELVPEAAAPAEEAEGSQLEEAALEASPPMEGLPANEAGPEPGQAAAKDEDDEEEWARAWLAGKAPS